MILKQKNHCMDLKISVTLINCISTFSLNLMANPINMKEEIKELSLTIYNKKVEIHRMRMIFMDICKESEWDCL